MRKRVLALGLASFCLLLVAPMGAGASNDPFFPQQWGMHNVNAEPAWNMSRGAGVLIGIVDSGVRSDHPDLAGKVIAGRDFGGGNGEDQNGHGTLVAGVVAARTGNGEGIAGVAPDARILPARVFDAAGNATSDKVAEAIRWTAGEARRLGSKLVLNLSFVGPPGSGGSGELFTDPQVRSAILDAAAGGATVVAAAGNDGSANSEYDAPDGKGIIVVGASNKANQCAGFSNYGSGLDILAPGEGILSTYWNSGNGSMSYASSSGTSMAVPFVSGAAALLMSKGMNNVSAVNRIISTARGPAVSCRGESASYKLLDVAGALGASLAAAAPPPVQTSSDTPAKQSKAKGAPRQPVAPGPPAAPPPPPPPPPPTLVLQPHIETLALPAVVKAQARTPVAAPLDPIKWSAAALFAVTALMQLVLRFIFKPAS